MTIRGGGDNLVIDMGSTTTPLPWFMHRLQGVNALLTLAERVENKEHLMDNGWRKRERGTCQM